MTWTKLSDDFSDDCETLDDDAFRLHVEGLGWSNRKLLDCAIPKDHLRRFAKNPAAVGELLAVGWWHDAGSHYMIIHHACYQRTREAVLEQQAVNAKNGRRGGRPCSEQASDLGKRNGSAPLPEPEETEPVSDSISETETEGVGTGRAGIRELPEQPVSVAADRPPLCPECSRAPATSGGLCDFCAARKRAVADRLDAFTAR